jgi:hypothetical protein
MDPHLQARLHELRKELAEVEAKIAEFAPKVSIINFKAEVLNMSDTKEWKDFMNTGVVENILRILDESYNSYIDCMEEEFPNIKPTDFIGKFGSSKWLKWTHLTLELSKILRIIMTYLLLE